MLLKVLCRQTRVRSLHSSCKKHTLPSARKRMLFIDLNRYLEDVHIPDCLTFTYICELNIIFAMNRCERKTRRCERVCRKPYASKAIMNTSNRCHLFIYFAY